VKVFAIPITIMVRVRVRGIIRERGKNVRERV
jgi:hypothetical protein